MSLNSRLETSNKEKEKGQGDASDAGHLNWVVVGAKVFDNSLTLDR